MSAEEDRTHSFEMLAVGSRVARYSVRSVLGSGGMGIVYLAYDEDLKRQVALKFLPPHLCHSEECRQRFKREAQMVAQINHPNIVTVHEVSEYDGRPFIAMEHVEGGTLAGYASSHRLSLEQILELGMQISDGLAEAHRQGIIHGDVKPSNILVSERGQVKIADFGLAEIRSLEQSEDSGRIRGTVAYLSPEQVNGSSADSRSDLFSLGVVLYEILTGTTPFTGADLGETLKAIVQKEPLPMAEYSSGTPLELEQIVRKLLRKDPALRYQLADDLRSDLRFALEAVASGRVQYPGRKKDYARSIAVLPFSNLSADQEQQYFCDGMAEEIINALTKIKELRVAARTSAFAFRNSKEDIREIGRKLHVETLLEGSVRRYRDRLRVSVQLIDAVTAYHIWTERFDEELKDVFAIQDEIAQNVVRALKVIISEDEQVSIRGQTTSDPKAYDYYLRGRQYLHLGRRQSLQFAHQMFTKAVEVDPDYALAYAGIADCCALLIHFYGESTDTRLAEADAASARALELDPKLAQAHSARGLTLWLADRFDDSRVEFETAIKMDPGLAETRYLYGRACFQRGEFSDAARLFEEACRNREYHEARFFGAQAYAAMGKDEEALTAYRLALRAVEKHIELNPDDARALTIGAVSLCRLGERDAGLEWGERALAADPNDAGIQYNVACLFSLEGQAERAIDCLEAAARAGFAHREWVEKDPDLDSLRSIPRFKALPWRT